MKQFTVLYLINKETDKIAGYDMRINVNRASEEYTYMVKSMRKLKSKEFRIEMETFTIANDYNLDFDVLRQAIRDKLSGNSLGGYSSLTQSVVDRVTMYYNGAWWGDVIRFNEIAKEYNIIKFLDKYGESFDSFYDALVEAGSEEHPNGVHVVLPIWYDKYLGRALESQGYQVDSAGDSYSVIPKEDKQVAKEELLYALEPLIPVFIN